MFPLFVVSILELLGLFSARVCYFLASDIVDLDIVVVARRAYFGFVLTLRN